MTKRPALDELKLLGLLWSESSSSPRSGLSTQSITAIAVGLADGDGLDAVTIRRLASEVGASTMALYPHIGGRAELIELMIDYVAGDTYAKAGVPEHSDWRARVAAIAEANWASCQYHPWLTEVSSGRSVPGPGSSAKYEIELQALDGIGLSDLEMEHTLTALISLVRGAARAALRAQDARNADEQNDKLWWSKIQPALAAVLGDEERYPTAARVSRALGDSTGLANDPEGAYRHGVKLLINGLAKQHGLTVVSEEAE